MIPLVAPSTASASSRAVDWDIVTSYSCKADVWILSARGSGQTQNSFGTQERAFLKDVKYQLNSRSSIKARAKLLRVQVLDLKYPATTVNLKSFITYGPKSGYRASVALGIAKAVKTISSSRKKCKNPPTVVLTGYSQGAQVMRYAARNLLAKNVPIASVTLIADPTNSFRKTANTMSYNGGLTWASPRSTYAGVANPKQKKILPTAFKDIAASVCDKRDSVCHIGPATTAATDVHRDAYRSKRMYHFPAQWLAKKVVKIHGANAG